MWLIITRINLGVLIAWPGRTCWPDATLSSVWYDIFWPFLGPVILIIFSGLISLCSNIFASFLGPVDWTSCIWPFCMYVVLNMFVTLSLFICIKFIQDFVHSAII